MTEDEARAWVQTRFGVSRETALAKFGDLLREEAKAQNLVALSTLDEMWTRHLADSAQLLEWEKGAPQGVWLDVGSGAGLPGVAVAILTDRQVVLVEPRAKRAAFLKVVSERLALSNVVVKQSKIEAYVPMTSAAIVSARAVANLCSLFSSTIHCTELSTVWILPKGRSARTEVATARMKWHGSFHVEQSVTQSDSGIVVAREVRRK